MDEQIIYIEQDTDQENVDVSEEDAEELISIDQESSEDENVSVENENAVFGMENVAVDEEDTEELISIDQESSEDENIFVENENVISGVEREHDHLIHRDYENQHPIEAITQLMQELAARPTEALSNMDIQNILNH